MSCVSIFGTVGRLLASGAIACTLGGCTGDMFSKDNSENWFSKPVGLFAKQDWALSGSNPSKLETSRPVAPEDLVDANGSCAAAPPQPAAADGETAAASPPAALGGAALAMTECEVVRRVGAPDRTEISANPGGERTAVLTVTRGAPGIYRFTGGRLAEIDRIEVPEAPKKPAPARKRAANAAR